MIQLNHILSHSFHHFGEPLSLQFFFTKDPWGKERLDHSQVWLVINCGETIIRYIKPFLILTQPRYIIQKIVEREVLLHMASELITDI
jgi:hypothetical protein